MRVVTSIALTFMTLTAVGFVLRRWVVLALFSLFVVESELAPLGYDGDGEHWFDDYYTVEPIDDQTFAIGEPRFSQQNFSYLIVGSERAVLFDSGPGVRDIRNVLDGLTALPWTAIPSHLHWDHVGHYEEFAQVAVINVPWLRSRAVDDVLRPTLREHLGFLNGVPRPSINVAEWLTPDSTLDLGGRTLQVIQTPGHTPESISLLDEDRGMLFTGDYMTEGALLAFAPGSDLGDYLYSVDRLLERVPVGTILLTGHRVTPPGAPILARQDLESLRATLVGIREGRIEGTGGFPRVYPVNEHLNLYGDFPFAADWR